MSILRRPIKASSIEVFFGIKASIFPDFSITDVVTDSRKASADSVFFALPGVSSNGWDYLSQVAALGCQLTIIPNNVSFELPVSMKVIKVKDAALSLGLFLREFAKNYPASVIGVTGTNGKSSISYYSAQLAQYMGVKSGIIGTFGVGPLNELQEAKQTTPDLLSLHEIVMKQASNGVQSLTFEASSHALDQQRTAGLPIDTAVFSNLSRDHLDYHGSMDAYATAKSLLFKGEDIKRAVVFLDDEYSDFMKKAASCPVYTYSIKNKEADFFASNLRFLASGVCFRLKAPNIEVEVFLSLLGEFNVANALAALAANWDKFDDKLQLLDGLKSLTGAPGRMQQIDLPKKPLVVVDYAHTPAALVVALQALKQHTAGRLFCVYGCGGDRDRGKRPLMTEAVLATSSVSYLTSDNPRNENPSAIMKDAITGIFDDKLVGDVFFMIEDRQQAIEAAIKAAKDNDTVLIAGKGHENYQEIEGVKHYFDDVEEATKVLVNVS